MNAEWLLQASLTLLFREALDQKVRSTGTAKTVGCHIWHLVCLLRGKPAAMLWAACREVHGARNWGRPLTNMKWGTEILRPTTHKELNSANNPWVSVLSDASAAPLAPWLGPCKRPWDWGALLTCTQIPDLQKL